MSIFFLISKKILLKKNTSRYTKGILRGEIKKENNSQGNPKMRKRMAT